MRLFLLCLTLFATQALAAGDFEGIITGQPLGGPDGAGHLRSLKMFLSPTGVRMEATAGGEMGSKGAGFNITMVWRVSDPNFSYLLNPANKTYLKHDITKAQQTAATAAPPTVEKLGTASYLGRTVQKVKVTFQGGKSQELWVDSSVRFPASALAVFGQEQGNQRSPWKALEKAGVVGIPVKDIDADGKSGWEATSIEKKSLPASLFQVPSDYQEAKSAMDMLPAEQQAKMKQQLDSMTPEQRARVEEAMKKAAQ
jgi:Domain of unknown function (DUF4412)